LLLSLWMEQSLEAVAVDPHRENNTIVRYSEESDFLAILIVNRFVMAHSITTGFFLSFLDNLIPALPFPQHQLKRSRSIIRSVQACIFVYHRPRSNGYACTDVRERSLISHDSPVASPFAHGTATSYSYNNTTTLDAYRAMLSNRWLPYVAQCGLREASVTGCWALAH